MTLFWGAVCFGAGLLVGWNLLPQPQWVRNLWVSGEEKLKN